MTAWKSRSKTASFAVASPALIIFLSRAARSFCWLSWDEPLGVAGEG